MNSLSGRLTIISINYNNDGIYRTIDSIQPLLNNGAIQIIQNGGKPLELLHNSITIINEFDSGIYNAINRAIKKVETDYFMLIHSGDEFIGSVSDMLSILTELDNTRNDISLNSQYIGKRMHSSKLWKPWMLKLGTQPPHLPTIYRSMVFKYKTYNDEIPIIADYDFFKTEVDWNKHVKHNFLLIKMETGGATSGGIKSFIKVSSLFIEHYKINGVLMSLTRIPFKLIQSII